MIDYMPSAEKDMRRIVFECAIRSGPTRAVALFDRIDSTIRKTLGVFPEGGRLRPEFGIGIRSYPIVPYVVFYRAQKRGVEILRVIHGYRDINRNILSLLAS